MPTADDAPDDLGAQDAVAAIAHGLRRLAIETVRTYNRQRVDLLGTLPDEPVLFVANHGFGGIVDLNVFALLAALDQHRPGRERVLLTHQIAWTLGVGAFLEAVGARPASRENALAAFAEGKDVVVFPGGDLEAAKAWKDRDKVLFHGRSGFARLALEAGVPIVPVVSAGAGESLLVLTDGKTLAEQLRLPKLLRYRALPVSLSVPWGLNVGIVGLLPYLPLPVRIETAILPALTAGPDEDAESFARRTHNAMQDTLTDLTQHRRLFLGRR